MSRGVLLCKNNSGLKFWKFACILSLKRND
jgi:hypothetical protein